MTKREFEIKLYKKGNSWITLNLLIEKEKFDIKTKTTFGVVWEELKEVLTPEALCSLYEPNGLRNRKAHFMIEIFNDYKIIYSDDDLLIEELDKGDKNE